MKYNSTTDKNIVVSASQAIAQGISTDGGLFVPQEIPQYSLSDIENLTKLDYVGRAKKILGDYLDDFTADEIDECVEKAYTKEKFGSDVMRKVEREVYLKVLDTLWMQHLENMQHLREGIHWRSVGQRDPLVEYRSESQKLFDGLQRNLREEVLKILLTITPAEAAADDVTDGEEYESELTKMAESQTERGVNEITKGERNLDDEFKKKTPSTRPVPRRTSKKSNSKKKKKKKSGKKRK